MHDKNYGVQQDVLIPLVSLENDSALNNIVVDDDAPIGENDEMFNLMEKYIDSDGEECYCLKESQELELECEDVRYNEVINGHVN